MYLTDKQLAERFNVSRQWVWMQAKRDATFPQPNKLTQGCTRFSLSEIEKYQNQCKEMSERASRHGRY
jgi:predicted DNA-binding transcriptional regulator AlpA